MPSASTARDNAVYGMLALSVALGLKQNNPSKLPSAVTNGLGIALTALGSWWMLRAVGNIKIGVTRKLGVPLDSKGGYKRRLGFLERWYVAHSRSGQHTGFSIALELEADPEHYPTLLDIRKILQRLSQKYPWLRVKVRRDGVNGVDSRESLKSNEDKEGYWGDDLYLEAQDAKSNVDLFALREVEILHDADYLEAFQKVLNEEGSTEWHDEDPNAAMWRATLLRQPGPIGKRSRFSLVLSFHHLIMDGIGSAALAQAILDESSVPNEAPSNLPQELGAPMEDLMDTVPTLHHILLPILLDRIPSLTPYFKPPHWKGATSHREDSRQCQVLCCPLALDGEQLKGACRKMNITANSLAVAALCKAVAKTVAGEDFHKSSAMTTKGGSTSVRFKVQVAKSERGSCNLLPTQHGTYVSGPQVYVAASDNDSHDWRSIGASFQRKLRASYKGAAMDIGLCPFISEDWIDFAKKFAKGEPNGVNDSFEVSSLGKVKLEDSAKWIVRNFWFSQGRKGTGAGLIFSMARSGSLGGDISAVFSAFPQAVPMDTLEQIAQAWKQEMQMAASTTAG